MIVRIFCIGLIALTAGCTAKQDQSAENKSPNQATNAISWADTNRQVYEVRGVVQEIKRAESKIVIKHEEIPNYMVAMTMPFEVKNTNELTGLSPGDELSFTMIVTETEGWIENLRKIGTSTNVSAVVAQPQRRDYRLVRDVDPVDIGDVMPDYTFTNSLGQKISFSDFKGQAHAFTFIFTRCPFPNFCPRMNLNFVEAYNQLAKMSGPTNWHLFSISFDTEYDTPDRLRAYSQIYKPDPKKWDWLTGALIDIDAITEQFGLGFAYREGTFDHNLRTVVVDASGKVQQIFIGNEWKPEELVDEIIKGAKAAAKRRSGSSPSP